MSPLRFLAIVAATMLILACATWALGPVAAGETIDWNVKTIATIRATTEPGAVAEDGRGTLLIYPVTALGM